MTDYTDSLAFFYLERHVVQGEKLFSGIFDRLLSDPERRVFLFSDLCAEALKILSQRRSADSSEAVLLGDAGRFYHDVVFHIRSPQTVSMKFFSILLNSMMLIASRTRVVPQLRR